MAAWRLGGKGPQAAAPTSLGAKAFIPLSGQEDAELSPESTGASHGEVIRDYSPPTGVTWRWGRPNYAVVNREYFAARSTTPKPDSLEATATRLIKNWEVEAKNIYDSTAWTTMDPIKFRLVLNGGTPAIARELAERGPANIFVGETPGYSSKARTFQESSRIFKDAFPLGFAWEVLQVLCPPPTLTFKWRHFGHYTGVFVDSEGEPHGGDGRLIEVQGLCVARLASDSRLEEIQVFFDPAKVIGPLASTGPPLCGLCPFGCSSSRGSASSGHLLFGEAIGEAMAERL